MTLAFWFVAVPGAIVAPVAAASTTVPPRPTLALVSVGVFAGAFAWVCFFTTLIARLRHFGRERWIAWIDLAGGVTLLTFAARAIWRIADSTL